MDGTLITGIIGLFSTIISAFLSWMFARKKYNTEVDHNYIENLGEGLKTYDSIIAHNKSEIEYLMQENTELKKEVAELRKQVFDLTMNICLDLTCIHRVRENKRRKVTDKVQSRLNETKVKDNEKD